MFNTPVGLVYDWYRGHGQDGREYLVTVWDNGQLWIQYRDIAADSFGRPVVCKEIGGHRLSDASKEGHRD